MRLTVFKDKLRRARHEAGHVVAGHYCDIEVLGVSLTPTVSTHGYRIDAGCVFRRGAIKTSAAGLRFATFGYAGSAAENLFYLHEGLGAINNQHDDREFVRSVGDEIRLAGWERMAFNSTAWDRSCRLVRMRKLQIEKFARLLARKGRIDRREIQSFFGEPKC